MGLQRLGSIKGFSIGKPSLISVLWSKTSFPSLVCVEGFDFWGFVLKLSEF
jgi:hypothetical protein